MLSSWNEAFRQDSDLNTISSWVIRSWSTDALAAIAAQVAPICGVKWAIWVLGLMRMKWLKPIMYRFSVCNTHFQYRKSIAFRPSALVTADIIE